MLSEKALHVIVMLSVPIVIFFYKSLYYIITKNSKKTGDFKIQIGNSFQDMKMLLILNVTLVSLIHLSLYVDIIYLKMENDAMFYTPALIEGLMYGILPIIRDLILSSTKNVKFDKLITYIGVFLRIGLYAKSIFSKDTKIEIKMEETPQKNEEVMKPTLPKIYEHPRVKITKKVKITDIKEINNTTYISGGDNHNGDVFDDVKTIDLDKPKS